MWPNGCDVSHPIFIISTPAITGSPFFNPKTSTSYLLTSVGTPLATALLQHGIQFPLPLKLVSPIQCFKRHLKYHLIAGSLTIKILRPATWRLQPAPPMLDYCARYKFPYYYYYYVKCHLWLSLSMGMEGEWKEELKRTDFFSGSKNP